MWVYMEPREKAVNFKCCKNVGKYVKFHKR